MFLYPCTPECCTFCWTLARVWPFLLASLKRSGLQASHQDYHSNAAKVSTLLKYLYIDVSTRVCRGRSSCVCPAGTDWRCALCQEPVKYWILRRRPWIPCSGPDQARYMRCVMGVSSLPLLEEIRDCGNLDYSLSSWDKTPMESRRSLGQHLINVLF